jgi:hypothetical protein
VCQHELFTVMCLATFLPLLIPLYQTSYYEEVLLVPIAFIRPSMPLATKCLLLRPVAAHPTHSHQNAYLSLDRSVRQASLRRSYAKRWSSTRNRGRSTRRGQKPPQRHSRHSASKFFESLSYAVKILYFTSPVAEHVPSSRRPESDIQLRR